MTWTKQGMGPCAFGWGAFTWNYRWNCDEHWTKEASL